MTIYRLDIEIKGLPQRPNQSLRANLFANRRESAKWVKLVWQFTLGKRPSKPLPRARLELTRHSSVEPDFDGCVASFKPVIDGLVRAGILEDDKISNIGSPFYRWSKARPREGKIRIQVDQID